MKTVLVTVLCLFLVSASMVNYAEAHRRFQKGLMLGYILGSQRKPHHHVIPVHTPVHHHHGHGWHGHGHQEHGHGHQEHGHGHGGGGGN